MRRKRTRGRAAEGLEVTRVAATYEIVEGDRWRNDLSNFLCIFGIHSGTGHVPARLKDLVIFLNIKISSILFYHGKVSMSTRMTDVRQ